MSKSNLPNYVRVQLNKGSSQLVSIMPFDRLKWELMPPTICPVEDLPMWMQNRLAVLVLITPKENPIPGVGVRISEDIFWVDSNDT